MSSTLSPTSALEDALPFRMGTPEEFRAVRDGLREAGYTYEALYRRPSREAAGRAEVRLDALEALCIVLFDGLALPWDALEQTVKPALLDALRSLRVLRALHENPSAAGASVLLYPVRSVYVASDHPLVEPRPGETQRGDYVFAAMSRHTQEYLSLVPTSPCDAFLEMCGGAGPAAIEAARFARHAWTLDITERSTRFARFNAALNGAANVTALRGDLYEPVRGRTFDRIVAHPPYVPAVQQTMIFRDGGEDGEQVTRRMVVELPAFLRPGGRFYCVSMLTDRVGAPIEQRLRTMLGAAADEFDVLVLELSGATEPAQFFARRALKGLGTRFDEVEARRQAFDAMGVTHLVYSLVVLQRRERPRPVFTVRRPVGDTLAAQVEWMVDWEVRRLDPGAVHAMLDQPVAVHPWVRLSLRKERREGRFLVSDCVVESNVPTGFEAPCSVWVGRFLEACDGEATLRDHFDGLRNAKLLPEDLLPERFAELMADLVGAGVIAVPSVPGLPAYDAPPWRRAGALRDEE